MRQVRSISGSIAFREDGKMTGNGFRRILGMNAVIGLATLAAGCGGDGQAAPPLPPAASGGSSGGSSSSGGAGLSNPHLVFTAGDLFPTPTAVQEIYTVNTDGSGLSQLTGDGLQKFLPHFSPDGTKLLYTKFLRGGYGASNALTDVFLLDRASGREMQLTYSGVAVQPVWSPNGQQIAFGTLSGNGIWLMNADGAAPRMIAQPSGAPDDQRWGDYLWSSDNWIYFTAAQDIGGCFKVRIDRIRPDGNGRTQITDGGPNCTPAGMEQNGDADPGISPDGKTLYSSRGLPASVPGLPGATIRHLFKFSSDPFTPGKVETDLSLPTKADCIAGVPKVSPDGGRIALFLLCPADPNNGVTLTDPVGARFTFVLPGFGPDWNPAAR
jgi:hypothetical protein